MESPGQDNMTQSGVGVGVGSSPDKAGRDRLWGLGRGLKKVHGLAGRQDDSGQATTK